MREAWRFVALGIAACAAAALWPLTAALSPTDALQARLAIAAIAAVACAILAVSRALRPAVLVTLSIASAVAGAGLLLAHFDAMDGCLADYDSRPVVIGREYTPETAGYVRDNPGLSPSDRLLDAGGDPARIWTAASIRSCRFWVSWGGLASIPLFVVCAGALMASRRYRFSVAAAPRKAVAPRPAVRTVAYDAFLSYRHTEPDKTHATDILESLEARGLRVAIDVRDFAPNEHFLSEMERCIKESRFVLCIITSQYLESEHTSEEAIISKALDMAERRKRLVPLIFERVELPVWLHGLVGIDFTPTASVEPLERLSGLLSKKSGVDGGTV
jgi:hypothetical protein